MESGLFAASGRLIRFHSQNSDILTGSSYRRSLRTCIVGIMVRKLAY